MIPHEALIQSINDKGVSITDEEYARREVALQVPDFPDLETISLRSLIYALASALEGTTMACHDCHGEIKRLRDVMMAVMDNCGCCEGQDFCENCKRIDNALGQRWLPRTDWGNPDTMALLVKQGMADEASWPKRDS